MITAGNAQLNQSQYPSRTNYPNRGGRPFYSIRQYGDNQGYGNPGFTGILAPQAAQEAYFHDLSNGNFFPEGYHEDFETYPQKHSTYHASDDHFHDAEENKASDDDKEGKDKEVDVGFVSISYHVTTGKMKEQPVCRKCQKEFPSNNQLHAHLEEIFDFFESTNILEPAWTKFFWVSSRY